MQKSCQRRDPVDRLGSIRQKAVAMAVADTLARRFLSRDSTTDKKRLPK
jgi:hypothetical protein